MKTKSVVLLLFSALAFAAGPATATAATNASFTYAPSSPETGESVSFDASSSTCDDEPCTYRWADDGGDGAGGTQWPLGTGETLRFTFRNVGTKRVRLTVTDDDGVSDSTMRTFAVAAPGPDPGPSPSPVARARARRRTRRRPRTRRPRVASRARRRRVSRQDGPPTPPAARR